MQNISNDNHFGLKSFTNVDLEKLSFLPLNIIKLLKSHRGFDTVDNLITNSNKYYLYTGRGTSNASFHIGHLLGLRLILELQKVLLNTKCNFEAETEASKQTKIYFMISDDEKIFRDNIDQTTMNENVTKTIDQLHKLGFNETNTNIHINSNGINKHSYSIMIKLMSILTVDLLNNIFGPKSNIGELFYVAYQLMPCFIDKNKQCIVIAGEDQDPFFRLARDIAHKLHCKPPIILYTKNFLGLDGSDKMSTSKPETIPIFISDTDEIIRSKINKIKKVGAGTLDELFDKGSDLSNDVPFQLIEFLESDINKINLIKEAYTTGIFESDEKENKISLLKNIKEIPEKAIITKNNKTMITTHGVRSYLTHLIIKELATN
jgi:tryptophanyl-tRNA synthetase